MEESILHFFKMAIPFADHIRRFTRKTTLPFFLIDREGEGGDKGPFLAGEIFSQVYHGMIPSIGWNFFFDIF